MENEFDFITCGTCGQTEDYTSEELAEEEVFCKECGNEMFLHYT